MSLLKTIVSASNGMPTDHPQSILLMPDAYCTETRKHLQIITECAKVHSISGFKIFETVAKSFAELCLKHFVACK